MNLQNQNNSSKTVEDAQDVKNNNHELSENTSDIAMIEKDGIDWAKIKAEYLCGLRPNFLSEKYKIPVDTIRSRIKRGEWHKEKNDTSDYVKLRVREEFSETLVEIQILTREEYRIIYSCIREKLKLMITQNNDLKDICIILKALNECRENEFNCVAISDASDKNLYSITKPVPIEKKKEIEEELNQKVDPEEVRRIIEKLRTKLFGNNI